MPQHQPDLYARITNRIVADLEQGVRPWLKPWSADKAASHVTRPLRYNGIPYRGINVLVLWGEAMAKGFVSSTWMTYRQAVELGGQVRKGEHGSLVVYADRFTRTETDDSGEDVERRIPFLRSYVVFNVGQIDGLPERYSAPAAVAADPITRDAAAEAFFAATGADIRNGGDRACYAPGPDFIQMPPFAAFRDVAAYYETLGHECVHWTSHRSRLDRSFGQKRWGDEAYAVEELVAELGSAFLCADLGLSAEPRPDHASYIASWLKVLMNDKRAIFTAAAHAERATTFLHGRQPNAESRVEPEQEAA